MPLACHIIGSRLAPCRSAHIQASYSIVQALPSGPIWRQPDSWGRRCAQRTPHSSSSPLCARTRQVSVSRPQAKVTKHLAIAAAEPVDLDALFIQTPRDHVPH